uniref:Putative secreted protein n=1 Tax=Amblyomma americanum TaxID=6943 RepID=A0A0C9RWB5_AMBAM
MKISVQLALVVVFVLLNFSWAEEEAAQEERPETTAESLFRQFCGMQPKDRNALLTCLGEQLPEVVKEIEGKGYELSSLPETVCNKGGENFPPELLLPMGKALPHVESCLRTPEA